MRESMLRADAKNSREQIPPAGTERRQHRATQVGHGDAVEIEGPFCERFDETLFPARYA